MDKQRLSYADAEVNKARDARAVDNSGACEHAGTDPYPYSRPSALDVTLSRLMRQLTTKHQQHMAAATEVQSLLTLVHASRIMPDLARLCVLNLLEASCADL
jgi:hypothetical protein